MSRRILLLTASLCLLTSSLQGQYCESVASGLFTDPSTWSTGVVPFTADSVVIKHHVYWDSTMILKVPYVKLESGWLDSYSLSGSNLTIESDEFHMDSLSNITCWNATLRCASVMELHGDIFSYQLVSLSSFNNSGEIHTVWGDISLLDSLPSVNSGFLHPDEYNIILNGPLFNAPQGQLIAKFIETHDTIFNQGSIWSMVLKNYGYMDGDSTGNVCVSDGLQNYGTITGTQDLCDDTPGSLGDIPGILGPDLTSCEGGSPCFLVGVDPSATLVTTLSPVPASDRVEIKFSHAGTGTCTLLNPEGQCLKAIGFTHAQVMEMDVSQLPAGIYLLQIQCNRGNTVKKLVVY